ncbi:MAG: phosphodiester glycosidase family protein [Verrucomicrobia bacterium]|nr:phosphodiester glycosidase family protein [Verrucomicrobiota bacterium]
MQARARRDSIWAAVLLAGVALPVTAAIKVGAWTPVYHGIDLARGEADAAEARLQQVWAVRIDLRDPEVVMLATPGNGDAPLETTSETTVEFVQRHGVQVAVNASFFEPCCTPGDKDLVGLAMSRGEIVSPPVRAGPGDCVLAITRDNRAVITKSDERFRERDYWTAVAGSGIILAAGVKPAAVTDPKNTAAHPRTAAGLSADGRFLFFVVIDGRQPGYSMGATVEELADWLLRFGGHDGLNLDGGASTTLVRAVGGKPQILNRPSGVGRTAGEGGESSVAVRGLRSVGNNLGVFAKSLPGAPAGK